MYAPPAATPRRDGWSGEIDHLTRPRNVDRPSVGLMGRAHGGIGVRLGPEMGEEQAPHARLRRVGACLARALQELGGVGWHMLRVCRLSDEEIGVARG